MAGQDTTENSSMVTVHVYRAEEGGYWAEMPEYPGCYTQAETMDELEGNVREAVQCYIDAGYADHPVTQRSKEPKIRPSVRGRRARSGIADCPAVLWAPSAQVQPRRNRARI